MLFSRFVGIPVHQVHFIIQRTHIRFIIRCVCAHFVWWWEYCLCRWPQKYKTCRFSATAAAVWVGEQFHETQNMVQRNGSQNKAKLFEYIISAYRAGTIFETEKPVAVAKLKWNAGEKYLAGCASFAFSSYCFKACKFAIRVHIQRGLCL